MHYTLAEQDDSDITRVTSPTLDSLISRITDTTR